MYKMFLIVFRHVELLTCFYFWNQILSTKDKKMQEQDKRRITTHFVPLLPQLLAKVHSQDSLNILSIVSPVDIKGKITW